VFQHTIALACLLQRSGIIVRVHMPDWNEQINLDDVDVCRCVRWRTGSVPRHLRRATIAARFATSTNAHIQRQLTRGDVLHVQGLWWPPLMAAVIVPARARQLRVVHSPHNTFARHATKVEELSITLLRRLVSRSIVFSEADARYVAAHGGTVTTSPLILLVPDVQPVDRQRWRQRWNAHDGDQVILAAGHIRADKRLDLLVKSAVGWPSNWRLAIVGADHGGWAAIRDLTTNLSVSVAATIGYLPLHDFAAALAAADVIVCPYGQGSQSGVLSLAASLEVRTVASDVGGLAELADAHFTAGDMHGLTQTLHQVIARPLVPRRVAESRVLSAHLAAYNFA
jgi:Glycosyl transferases group 1/Glycosyltransferase Family 4